MLALAQGESEIRGDDVMNALAGEEAKLPTANVAAAARRRRDGMVAVGSTVLSAVGAAPINRLVVSAASRSPSLSGNLPVFIICSDNTFS